VRHATAAEAPATHWAGRQKARAALASATRLMSESDRASFAGYDQSLLLYSSVAVWSEGARVAPERPRAGRWVEGGYHAIGQATRGRSRGQRAALEGRAQTCCTCTCTCTWVQRVLVVRKRDFTFLRAPLHRATTEALRSAADVELYSATALYISTALQRSTLYLLSLHPPSDWGQGRHGHARPRTGGGRLFTHHGFTWRHRLPTQFCGVPVLVPVRASPLPGTWSTRSAVHTWSTCTGTWSTWSAVISLTSQGRGAKKRTQRAG